MMDAFPERQQRVLNSRSMARFGKEITKEEGGLLQVGKVFPVVIRSFQSFTPQNATPLDCRRMISGGYPQRHVHLTLALVIREEADGQFEVELESPLCLSYRDGPTTPSASYLFCKDGRIQHRDDDRAAGGGVSWKDWRSGAFEPEWSIVGMAGGLLPDVFSGFDL